MMPSAISLKMAGIAGLVLLLLLGAAFWRADHLSGELDVERAEHSATKEALAREVEKGMEWMAAYEDTLQSAEALRETAQACLERAAQTETARKEREALLQTDPPRPRTKAETKQVVNDEVRKRAADRLNRPF